MILIQIADKKRKRLYEMELKDFINWLNLEYHKDMKIHILKL